MNSVRLVFVQRFVRELRAYVSELEAMQRFLAQTADTAKRIAIDASQQLGTSGRKCKCCCCDACLCVCGCVYGDYCYVTVYECGAGVCAYGYLHLCQ